MARGGPATNGRVLADAVPWYVEHDPRGLSDLLYNLHIFGRRYRRADYEFVRAMVRHHHYLTRCSAVGLLSTSSKVSLQANQTRQLLRTLAQDQNPRVRTEARWVLDGQRPARTESRPHWGGAAFARRILQREPYPP